MPSTPLRTQVDVGRATALVQYAEQYACEQGASSIFLLTTTAEDFFRRRGYVTADRTTAPAAIRATRGLAHLYTASSAFLVKTLESSATP